MGDSSVPMHTRLLLLEVADAVLRGGLVVHDDGVHVLTHGDGDRRVVLLLRRLAQLDDAAVHDDAAVGACAAAGTATIMTEQR